MRSLSETLTFSALCSLALGVCAGPVIAGELED